MDSAEVEEFKSRVGKGIDGHLPIQIVLTEPGNIQIEVKKQGPYAKFYAEKTQEIAEYLNQKIHFNFIPAIRTQNEAMKIINNMIYEKLSQLEKNEKYEKAIENIESIQKEVLKGLGGEIKISLQEFLPDVEDVQLSINKEERRRSYARDVTIHIDDGVNTLLQNKGDGVKSLVALSLLKDTRKETGASVIAIEEPEAHLHPGGIHQTRDIFQTLSEKNQIIISTHCPSFVNRETIASNIIVEKNRAGQAKSIESVRNTLGVQASDNLLNARVVLLVEGKEDERSTKALLRSKKKKIAEAIDSGVIIFEQLGGATKLPYKLSFYNNMLCKTISLLDNDKAGRDGLDAAQASGVVDIGDIFLTNCQGMGDSEFEDAIKQELYKDFLLEKYGVDINISIFKTKSKKWSDRLKEVFKKSGKPWNDTIQKEVKEGIAKLVSEYPEDALEERKESFFTAYLQRIERVV